MRKSEAPSNRAASHATDERLRLEYEDYLRNQRGLSEKSIYDCRRFADRFLHFRFKRRRPNLSKITPADIARFMQHLISRGKPFRDKTPPAHLRNFFRFLFKSGRTTDGLLGACQSDRVYGKDSTAVMRNSPSRPILTIKNHKHDNSGGADRRSPALASEQTQ
jgi:site-specific recombinase XerD